MNKKQAEVGLSSYLEIIGKSAPKWASGLQTYYCPDGFKPDEWKIVNDFLKVLEPEKVKESKSGFAARDMKLRDERHFGMIGGFSLIIVLIILGIVALHFMIHKV